MCVLLKRGKRSLRVVCGGRRHTAFGNSVRRHSRVNAPPPCPARTSCCKRWARQWAPWAPRASRASRARLHHGHEALARAGVVDAAPHVLVRRDLARLGVGRRRERVVQLDDLRAGGSVASSLGKESTGTPLHIIMRSVPWPPRLPSARCAQHAGSARMRLCSARTKGAGVRAKLVVLSKAIVGCVFYNASRS